ncbi:DNAJ heat shock N-terminal domain-containing protein [Abeliophyllum distichum]|uniref:DNAJ heat shock N-terminal domain-containing protein n=1 Tax=Abeliophyllum distichum TaxID=126358 RepID=A0ABD1VY07_9LAMI
MECNRDEALRAKTIAEDKLEKKDFAGARKFALKAHTLFPGLEGITQLLTTLDVYISGENKINGEVDWYGVIGVNPSCDDETIKKQYRKLALLLHPDKNKIVGADGAFKLLSEAWSMLSDTAKRFSYNQRRGSRGVQQRVPMHTGGPSAASCGNGYHNVASRTTSVLKTKNNGVKVPPTSVPTPSHPRTDTFWTICRRCMMHYEYLKIYLNHTLLCPNCHKAFLASEAASPFNNRSKSSNPAPPQRHQNLSNHAPSQNAFDTGRNATAAKKSGPGQAGPNSFRHANFQPDSRSGAVGVSGKDPSIATKAANVVKQVQQKLKRAYTESHAPTGLEGDIRRRKLDNDGDRYGMNNNMGQENGGFGRAGTLGSRIYHFPGIYSQPNSTRELTLLETRKMLMEMAKKEIRKKLNEWKSRIPSNTVNRDSKKVIERKREKHKNTHNGKVGLSSRVEEQADKRRVSCSADNADKEDIRAASLNVPDPDFHDFDKDRTESSFGDNEVWAAYDDDDSMPRFYALINKVISRNPFKVRISWLNSKTNSEFGPIDWVGSGFYKTCGEFRVGRYETCTSINSFSQKVIWSKGPRGTIQIFPKKSDVWALYKNWSSDWNEHTPDEVIHSYDMVMVLDDYKEQGVSVAPLMKVIGFKTVFRPNLEPEMVKRIPKEEMFRFSHQVPHHLLTGQEGQNVPKGCLELDPAATPLELLQVIIESHEVPIIANGGDFKEEVLPSVPVTRLDEIDDGLVTQE